MQPIPHTVKPGTKLVGQSKCIWCGRWVRSSEDCPMTQDLRDWLTSLAGRVGTKWRHILRTIWAEHPGWTCRESQAVRNIVGPSGLDRIKALKSSTKPPADKE